MRESSSTRAPASIAAAALIAGALYTMAPACSAVGPPGLGDPDDGTCTAGQSCQRTCDGACAVSCDDAANLAVRLYSAGPERYGRSPFKTSKQVAGKLCVANGRQTKQRRDRYGATTHLSAQSLGIPIIETRSDDPSFGSTG